MRLTLSNINRVLKTLGYNVELQKGDGYFYFTGELVERLPSTSVMVFNLNQLNLVSWVDEAQQMIAKQRGVEPVERHIVEADVVNCVLELEKQVQ